MISKRTYLLLSAWTTACCLLLLPGGIFGAEQKKSERQAGARETSIPGLEEDIPEWTARWELGRSLGYLKRYEEALDEYRKVLAERPSLTQARAEMAQILFYLGKKDEAFKELEKIPSDELSSQALTTLADLRVSQKDYQKAEPLYRRSLKNQPEDLKTRLKLAELLSWMKRYEESIAEYELILQKKPDDIQVRRKYALVLSWMGRHDDAANELSKTLK